MKDTEDGGERAFYYQNFTIQKGEGKGEGNQDGAGEESVLCV